MAGGSLLMTKDDVTATLESMTVLVRDSLVNETNRVIRDRWVTAKCNSVGAVIFYLESRRIGYNDLYGKLTQGLK